MIDFSKIISESNLYNFHSHTQFCDGRAEMEQFAQAAADSRFTHYGFSPHSPIPLQSPCDMKFSDVDKYIAEFNRLKSLYSDRLELYMAMEIDYLGDDWGPASPYFDSLPLDYRIGSVHFIPSKNGMVDVDGRFENFKNKMAVHFDNDIRYVVESFYSQTNRMIQSGKFDIIGHFDKIGHNASHFCPGIEDKQWYINLVNDIIDNIISNKLTVEINTKAKAEHNKFFPNEKYWKRLSDAGITIVINSDAHYPELINASRPEALTSLDRLRSN